jgi:hypothetical protein
MFGGAGEKQKIFTDLWSLKDSRWKKLSDNGPGQQVKTTFAYDANRNKAVLFGGSGSEPFLNDTWEWNGYAWMQKMIEGPPGRIHAMSVYDEKQKTILIFGGIGESGFLSDTWAYNGQWKEVNKDGPKNCLPHGMVYDEMRKQAVLITVENSSDANQTTPAKNMMWGWSGERWEKIADGPGTSPNSLQALAAFEKGEIVLFDGDDKLNNNGKTWRFDGKRWTSNFLHGPVPRIGHFLVFDESKKRTILFGGSNRAIMFNDVWEWNGKEWKEIK